MSLKYTVYECKSGEHSNSTFYNLYKHDLGGDFYLASFRYLNDLKNYLTLLDVETGEVYFGNVFKKKNGDVE